MGLGGHATTTYDVWEPWAPSLSPCYYQTWDQPPMVLPSNGGHQNMYSWQAGGTHATGMLSCLSYFWMLPHHVTFLYSVLRRKQHLCVSSSSFFSSQIFSSWKRKWKQYLPCSSRTRRVRVSENQRKQSCGTDWVLNDVVFTSWLFSRYELPDCTPVHHTQGFLASQLEIASHCLSRLGTFSHNETEQEFG